MAEQNNQAERAAFETWMKTRTGYPFAGTYANLMWDAWKASHRSTPAAGAVEKDAVKVTPEMIHAMKMADMAADYTGLGVTEQQRYTAIFNAAIEAHNRAGKDE